VLLRTEDFRLLVEDPIKTLEKEFFLTLLPAIRYFFIFHFQHDFCHCLSDFLIRKSQKGQEESAHSRNCGQRQEGNVKEAAAASSSG